MTKKQEECWQNGGFEAKMKVPKRGVHYTDCFSEERCPHIVECFRGRMRKPEDEGGGPMSDDEIRYRARDTWKDLKYLELMKDYNKLQEEHLELLKKYNALLKENMGLLEAVGGRFSGTKRREKEFQKMYG